MWRWGQRTVRDVGGIAKAALGYRADCDLRRLVVRDTSPRFGSTTASFALQPPASQRTPRNTLDPVSTPGEQVVATAPESHPDAPLTLDVHTDSPARGAIASTQPIAPVSSYASETHSTPRPSPKVVAFMHPGSLPSQTDPRRGTSSPLDDLRMLLSLKLTESAAHDLSADHIRCLYHSFRKRESFGPLRPYEYSALISLFGSLSLSKPGRPYRSIYGHHLVQHMEESFDGTYWDMIGLVAKDKRDYGLGSMTPSDCYWLMRMDAEALSTPVDDSQGSSVSAERRLKRIEINYSRIPDQPSPDLHVPYLEAMFSSHISSHVQAAVNRLRKLLTWYHGCPPTLMALLWRLALQSPPVAQAHLKAAVLDAVWKRLINSSHEPTGKSSAEATGSTSSRPPDTMRTQDPTDAIDLLPLLRGAIFDRPHTRVESMSTNGDVPSWALSVARKVFSPDHLDEHSIEHRWSCFLLLAVAGNPGAPTAGTLTHSFATWAAVVDWRTICALAYLQGSLWSKERPFDVLFPNEVVDGLGAMLGTLWDHWAGLPALDHAVRPCAVTRAICASFLHMASRLKNRGVISACRQFCDTRRLWDQDASASASLRSLVQEQLIALLLSGSDSELAVATTLDCTQDERLLSDVFSTVVTAFARENVVLAAELQQVARRVGIKLSTDSSVEVAVHLARQGALTPALACLSEAGLSSEQRLSILRNVLVQLVWRGHRFRSTHLTPDVVDSLVAHLTPSCPSAILRPTLESVLLVMPRHQYARPAAVLIEAIAQADKMYLSPAFFARFIRSLVRHRQFRIAERMYKLAQTLHDKTALPPEWLAAQLSHRGASTLAKKFAGSSCKTTDTLRVLRAVQFRERPPSPIHTLKLSRLLHPRRTRRRHQLPPGAAMHRALELLIRASRLRTVKRLYSELRATQSPRSRTALGNSILHASTQRPSRSQAHRGRRALTMLQELMEKYQFVPDRVTVNTLVKAYMQWTAGMTNEHLRALFDHFVRIGYPTGGAVPGGVPFGMAEGPPPVYLPEVDSPLSFGKHVRPLYKMFIKAFHRRGDVSAVRVVVRILKAVEAEAIDTQLANASRVERKRGRGRPGSE